MNIQAPYVIGPRDPKPRHCGRSHSDQLDEHIANGCTHRTYSEKDIAEFAASRLGVSERDQHDDCDIGCDVDLDGRCKCSCDECKGITKAIDDYDAQGDPPERDDDEPFMAWDDDA